MSTLFGTIASGFGWILLFLYNNLWFSYGLAIIVLTIILRIALLPLAIKSFNSMAKMNEVQPLMAELQRKYKNDKEKLNAEVMKVYQEKKVNPFGGCLPLIIQIPILYGLFLVISHPLTYMFSSPEVTWTNTFKSYVNDDKGGYYREVEFLEQLQQRNSIMKEILEELKRNPDSRDRVTYIEDQNIEKINLKFLGLSLGDIPKAIPPKGEEKKYIILWIVPILTGVTTYLSSKYGQMPTAKAAQNEMQNSMQKQMLIMMPLMTAWFAFVVPVGLSLYWFISNIFQIFQQKTLINMYLKNKEV